MVLGVYEARFKKDIEQLKGQRNLEKLKAIISMLLNEEPLPHKYKINKLQINKQICHIESDWLLVYKKDNESIYFSRTGNHAELF